MPGDSCARSGGRLFLPISVFVVDFLLLLHVAHTAVASAVDAESSAWEAEYGTSHLLRKRHELSPLAARGSRRGAAARDDDADDLRVVRAMQWAAESADTTQRRGMSLIAGACAAAPQARPAFHARLGGVAVAWAWGVEGRLLYPSVSPTSLALDR